MINDNNGLEYVSASEGVLGDLDLDPIITTNCETIIPALASGFLVFGRNYRLTTGF